jgi:SAM-dependent methyltransferase
MRSDYDIESAEYLMQGLTVFQSHLMAPTEETHCYRLWQLMGEPTNGHVVDMGCGVGSFAHFLKQFAPELEFTCVTDSEYQIEAMDRMNAPCTPVLADFRNVKPLADACADILTYNESLGYAPLQETLPEASRLLKKGGRLFIKDYARLSRWCPAEREWEYRFFWASEIIHEAERHGLVCQQFVRPASSYERYEKFYNASAVMQQRHPQCECDLTAAFYSFTKE